MNITVNIKKMFANIDPWDVSNSKANLGPRAAELTWGNALYIAEKHRKWLASPLPSTVEAIREHATGYGAWEREEIDAWTETECLALIVQEIASDMRLLGSDDHDFEECAEVCSSTDWVLEPEYPRVYLYTENNTVFGEFYLGD